MFGTFDVAASGLTAQRMRIDTIASNISNVDSPGYRRLYPIFQAQQLAKGATGVRVARIQQDSSQMIEKLEPWNPAADSKGIVRYANVDLATEMANAIESSRAYEANISAIETTKSMMNATLRILA